MLWGPRGDFPGISLASPLFWAPRDTLQEGHWALSAYSDGPSPGPAGRRSCALKAEESHVPPRPLPQTFPWLQNYWASEHLRNVLDEEHL